MTEFERGIIDIVKSALNGISVSLPIDFDWKKALEIAKNHRLVVVFYYAILNSKLSVPQDIYSFLEKETYKAIAINARQLHELERIYNAFEDNKIIYMPLKGLVLKHLYPEAELRSMNDADILIKYEHYESIKQIIQQMGYLPIHEYEHELVWDKAGSLHLELHKQLMPTHNKDFYEYFGDGWRRANPANGNRFELSDEDNFIYLFAHFAKHYRNAGIGIRHITDLYVFLDAKSNIDKAYIETELAKLQLLEFYKNTLKTIEAWFGDFSGDEITDFMTTAIIKSGSYGTHENNVLSNALIASKIQGKKNVKRNRTIALLFPSVKNISERYPFVQKVPIVLPLMWIVRGIGAIINRKGKVKKVANDIKLTAAKNIIEYQRQLNYVGLDFNYDE